MYDRASVCNELECCLQIFEEYLIFFDDTATTEIYTLSLHDALPILKSVGELTVAVVSAVVMATDRVVLLPLYQYVLPRSEEHTSELQSRENLVCRLLLEKKKKPATQPRNLT